MTSNMTSNKNKLRKIIVRRLKVFWKLVIFWAVIGFRKNFTVKAPKADYDGKHQKAWSKRRFRDVFFCKLVIVFFVMGFNKNFKVRYPKRCFDEIHQKLGEYEY